MGFDLDKRLANELNRLADDAAHEAGLRRPADKHVARMKQIAAELRARLLGEQNAQSVPGKQTEVAGAVARAIGKLDAAARRARGLGSALPWQHQRGSFDDYRAIGLREVLAAVTNRKLRAATVAAADPHIAARAGAVPATAGASAGGQAMWRAAERRAATLYRHAMDAGEAAGEDPIVDEALARVGSGQPLPRAVRAEMEAELGVSLARVRVHTDPLAAAAAKAVRAAAFTVGEDIFFAHAAYAPDTREGKKLLAHELAHVVQAYQGRTPTGGIGITVSQPGDGLEREAEAVATRFDEGAPHRREADAARVDEGGPAGRARRAERALPRARGSSPALAAPASAPTPAPVASRSSAPHGGTLLRRAEAQNVPTQPHEAPRQRTDDPDKRGTKPKLELERDRAGERATRAVKSGPKPDHAAAKDIRKRAKDAAKGSVDTLKGTIKKAKSEDVGKQAKQAGTQNRQVAKDAKRQATQLAKDAKPDIETPTAPGAGELEPAAGDAGAVRFKPISNWATYMPEELPDQDEREKKRIRELAKAKIHGDRRDAAIALGQLRKAQLNQARKVRAMLPGLQGQVRKGQAAAIANVNAAEAAQTAAVKSHVAGQQAQVRAHAAQTISQVNAAHRKALAAIRDAKLDAVQKLSDAKQKALSDIDAAESAQLAVVNLEFLATRLTLLAYGRLKSAQAHALGDSHPLPYDGDKLEAARKAAREVAAEYAKAMPEEARNAYEQIAAEKPNTEQEVRKIARDQRKQVREAFRQSKRVVSDAAEKATSAADEMKTQAVAQVQATSSATVSQLATHGAQQCAAIRATAGQARTGIQQAGASALAGLATSVTKTATGIEKGAHGLVAGAAQVEAPNPDETRRKVQESIQGLSQGTRQLAHGFRQTASGAVEGMRNQSAAAAGGMSQTATAAKQTATQMAAGAKQSMRQIAQGSSEGLQQLSDNFKKSVDEIAGKGAEGMQNAAQATKDAFGAATKQLSDALQGAVDSVKSSFDEAVPAKEIADIEANAKKAADAVKPWWQKALAFVVSIVVAIVVAVVITALIVTTGPVGAILVGAAAGALGSVLGQMASNLILGNGLMEGITWKTVALGALGGAAGAGITQGLNKIATNMLTTRLGAEGARAMVSGTGGGLRGVALRTGLGAVADTGSDAITQLVSTGKYEFDMSNLALSLATGAVTNTKRYGDFQDGIQNRIRNRVGHVQLGTPDGSPFDLTAQRKAPGEPVYNAPKRPSGESDAPSTGTQEQTRTGGGAGEGDARSRAPDAQRTASADTARTNAGDDGAGVGRPEPQQAGAGDGQPAATADGPQAGQQASTGDGTPPPSDGQQRTTTGDGQRRSTTSGDTASRTDDGQRTGRVDDGTQARTDGPPPDGPDARIDVDRATRADGDSPDGAPRVDSDRPEVRADGDATLRADADGPEGTPRVDADAPDAAPGAQDGQTRAKGALTQDGVARMRSTGDGPSRGDGDGPTARDVDGPRTRGDAAADGGDAGGAGKDPDGGGDLSPDAGGPESAAAGELAELGYPNPTRESADQAASALESGTTPPPETVRDTAANERGLQELRALDGDPALSPESKTNVRRDVAGQLRSDEPSGNLQRDVAEARVREEARLEAERQRQAQQHADGPQGDGPQEQGARTDAPGTGQQQEQLPTSVQEAQQRRAQGETWTNKQIRDTHDARNREIAQLDEQWKAEGMSAEQRARKAHELRQDMRLTSREMMSSDAQKLDLLVRDAQKYGAGEGPSFEQVLERTRASGLEGDAAYEAIIAGSQPSDRATGTPGASGQERMPDASLPPGTTVHGDGLRFTGSNGQEYTVRVKRGDGPTRTVRNPDGTFDIFIGKDVPQHVAVRSVADEIASLAGTPRQTSNSLDTLYEHAAVAQRELGDLTRSIADELGGRPLIPDQLKGRPRAQEKIDADYGGEAARITDLARSSIEFDNPAQIREAIARFSQSGEVVRMKDRFERPADGYRDVMMNLRMSNGHIVEVQLHLKAILDVKNGPGHALYEQVRAIDARAKTENRALSADELAQRQQLVSQMTHLYDEAFEQSQRAGAAPDSSGAS